MKDEDIAEMLEWVDERFLKSFARIHCLNAITKGHNHGYDIMKHVEENHGLKVGASSIYPILQWLEEKGYVTGEWEPAEGKPGKKNYSVTEKGKETLRAAKERMLTLIDTLSVDK